MVGVQIYVCSVDSFDEAAMVRYYFFVISLKLFNVLSRRHSLTDILGLDNLKPYTFILKWLYPRFCQKVPTKLIYGQMFLGVFLNILL